ncbi:putative transporter [Lachnellula suecica]|uniref:Putative transporter n=1 Tax=Lachnellula suecica TaxID=602035 RepID=A0A8T9CJF2_9HELO|nr:putative transporter [Lachnellula suecica]
MSHAMQPSNNSPNMSDENPTPIQDDSPATASNHQISDGAGSEIDFSTINEKEVLRKMDLHLLPMLSLLYLISFLDRGNIGNAKIEGLTQDLHMSGPQYNWCLTVFFFTYCAVEVPSNLMLRKLRPSVWLPTIMVAWGIVMTLMGIVQSYHGLLVARLFLGLCEGGLFPGVTYFITMWYCRHEGQLRQALFFGSASIAGAFSGLLAFGIAKMDGVGGLAGWRWIFILEGIATVLIAVLAFFVLYDFPDTAEFLSTEERAWVVHRLKYQGSKDSGQMVAETEKFQWKHVKEAFTDWQIFVGIWMYWGIVCALYGVSLFLPTIINELGYKSSTAQLLTIPIYVTSALLTVLVAYYSDKSRIGRAPFVFLPMCAILIGYIIALAASAHGNLPGLVYAGVFIAACGIYPAFPGNITWLSNNLAGSYKRGAGMAVHLGVGHLGGAMASNFYRDSDKPKFLLGHSLEIGFVSPSRTYYSRVNSRRVTEGNEKGLSLRVLSEMGDKAPTFRYMI